MAGPAKVEAHVPFITRRSESFRYQKWLRALVFAATVLGAPLAASGQNGVVTGTVSNATTGAPVTTGTVVLCQASSQAVCVTFAISSTGAYIAPVPAGTYVAYTSGTGLVNQILGGVECPITCDDSSARVLGSPLVVTSGVVITGRNFALRPTGTISGRVTDSVSGAGIANVFVNLLTVFGDRVVQAKTPITNASGAFTAPGLGPGTYFAFTASPIATQGSPAAQGAHVNEIFGDLLCLGSCNSEIARHSGAPIGVTSGATTNGVDLALDRAGTITGKLTNAATSAPLPNVQVSARFRNARRFADLHFADVTDATGAYAITGLPADTYYVSTEVAPAIKEVFANRPCTGFCSEAEIALGDPVVVPTGGTVPNVDFALDPGGTISGVVKQAGSTTSLVAKIELYRQEGATARLVAFTTSNAGTGAFTMSGLTTGTYFAVADNGDHAQEMFGGLPCLPCTPERIVRSSPISVTSGVTTSGLLFLLDPGATIAGTVRIVPALTPLAGVTVDLFRGGTPPILVGSTGTSSSGTYGFRSLPAGTYHVASRDARFDNQVYNGVSCPGGFCTPAFAASNGVPLQVASGGAVNGIDLALRGSTLPPAAPLRPRAVNAGGGVTFTWEAPFLSAAAASYVFEAGATSGTTFAALPVATTTLTVPGVPPGTYFIRVRAVNGAGTGPASEELTLRIAAGGIVLPEAPAELQAFVSDGHLTAVWDPPNSGPVPSGYLFEAGSAAGLANLAVVPVPRAGFVFNGVPPGAYFFRVRAVVAGQAGPPSPDVLVVVGNAPAPPSRPELSVSVTGRDVQLSWRAPIFGPVTSFLIEAGSAPGLANLAAFDTRSAATSLLVPGVPSGTYHVRVKAKNLQGVSLASDEQVLVVP